MSGLLEAYRLYPGPASIICLSAWGALVGAILWPFGRTRLLNRGPLILTGPNVLLDFGLMALPKALAGSFQVLLGHSVYARLETGERWIELDRKSVV